MGLTLSKRQTAKELGLNDGDTQIMTTQRRENLVAKKARVAVLRTTRSPSAGACSQTMRARGYVPFV
jgi:hypothetical protein